MRDIIIIAAVAENSVIGKDNKMIWHLPNDLKRFKELTKGHHIVMGRKTFESLPGILPNRTHVIVTRNKEHTSLDETIVVYSLEQAIEVCPKDQDIYIVGGAEIYKQALDLGIVTKMELTLVRAEFVGDTFFPAIPFEFSESKKVVEMPKDEKHSYNYEFITLTK